MSPLGAEGSRGKHNAECRPQHAIVHNSGEENDCGWCKGKWGVNWQVTPRVLTEAYTDPDPAVAKRAFEAMMTMRKIDVAAIEAARRG